MDKPSIFIASSVEGKRIAEFIQANLKYDAYPGVWHQLIFTTSHYPLESLLEAVDQHNFAIIVLTPDDISTIRGITGSVPRTNVLFEAALFMGKYGRDRCFLVQSRQTPTLTPTDLQGLIPATYDEEHYKKQPAAALGPVCTEILNAIRKSKSFSRALTITPKLELDNPTSSKLRYPKKLGFEVRNPTSSAVVVTSHDFKMGTRLKGDPKRRAGKDHFKVQFLAYGLKEGDIYEQERILAPGQHTRAWLALDRDTDDSVAEDAFQRGEIGTWRFTCYWLSEPMERREYEVQF